MKSGTVILVLPIHHLTDSLRCMRDLVPVSFSVGGIGGVTCNVSLKGKLTVVFITEDN